MTSFHSRRGRPRTRPIRPAFPPRKVGRPLGSTKKTIIVHKESEDDEIVSSAINEEVSCMCDSYFVLYFIVIFLN